MSNVVHDFHNFRAVSIYILGIFCEIYFDRTIMYLDQSTLLKSTNQHHHFNQIQKDITIYTVKQKNGMDWCIIIISIFIFFCQSKSYYIITK